MDFSENLLDNIRKLTENLSYLNENGSEQVSKLDLSGLQIDEENYSATYDDNTQKEEQFPQIIVPPKNYDHVPVDQNGILSGLKEHAAKAKHIEKQPVDSSDVHAVFKAEIKELAEIDDLIKEYTGIIQKLKQRKDILKQNSMKHMVTHKIDVAKMNNNESFTLTTTKTKVNPITKSSLNSKLEEYFVQEESLNAAIAREKADKILKWIYDKAVVKVSKVLRRKKPTAKKQK